MTSRRGVGPRGACGPPRRPSWRLRSAGPALGGALLGVLLASSAGAASVDLECPGVSLTLSTGGSSGDCLLEKGIRAVCLDASSNAAYARCDAGCLLANGKGSCSLTGEESVGGSLVLVCEDGARFLLRTRTGQGLCTGTVQGSVRTARCADSKDHSVEADCARGCHAIRGKALCAHYKRDDPDP